jgi:hypothetical protein
MWITTDQAAEIYARFCKARYGGAATKIVRQRAAELREIGDIEGVGIWNLVAQKIVSNRTSEVHSAA